MHIQWPVENYEACFNFSMVLAPKGAFVSKKKIASVVWVLTQWTKSLLRTWAWPRKLLVLTVGYAVSAGGDV